MMPERTEDSLRAQSLTENFEHSRIRARELLAQRNLIEQQERKLDEERSKIKQEQLARERKIQREVEAREAFYAEREKKLFERQKDVEEQLLKRQIESQSLRGRLESEIVNRESQLHEAMRELQLEKARYTDESRKKIESKSKDYVSAALDTLEKKESQFHRLSKLWSALGAISLLSGLVFFGYVTVASFSSLPTLLSWEFIVFSAFKGLVGLALFAALSKYSYLFGNAYMREALKNGDRRHAINFGKFYLESYGAAAEWNQIKDAFEHWNIDGANGFGKSSERQFSPIVFDKFTDAIEKFRKLLPVPQDEKK